MPADQQENEAAAVAAPTTDQHRQMVSATLEGTLEVQRPVWSAIAAGRQTQEPLDETVAGAARAINEQHAALDTIERTLAKLPVYTKKLQEAKRDMAVAQEEAKRAKAVASSIAKGAREQADKMGISAEGL